ALATGAVEISRIDKRGPGRVDLRDKRIAADIVGLQGSGRGRKVNCGSRAGNVGVAKRVYRDGVTFSDAAASEIGGISQYRINNQRSRGIKGADVKAYMVHTVRNVTDRDFLSFAIHFLISDRLALANVSLPGMQHEVSHAI